MSKKDRLISALRSQLDDCRETLHQELSFSAMLENDLVLERSVVASLMEQAEENKEMLDAMQAKYDDLSRRLDDIAARVE